MSNKPILSFEFFPPKTPEGMDELHATRKQLGQLNPEFFSVTFGAGGSFQSLACFIPTRPIAARFTWQ